LRGGRLAGHCQIKNTVAGDGRKSLTFKGAAVGFKAVSEGFFLQSLDVFAPIIRDRDEKLEPEIFL
jgi:hypothetical protein